MCFQSKLQIAALCGFLLAVTACSSLSKKDVYMSPSSSSTPTAAPTLVASADPRADVVKAMRASLNAKSYRTRRESTSSSSSNHIITAEFVAPDRMHITMEMDMPGRATVKSEKIYIGKEAYARTGDAPWQKDPMDMGDMLSQMRDPKLIDTITEKGEVKYLGTDTLNGVPMLVYQITIKDLLGPGDITVTKEWIGATDGLPHQTESESDIDLGTGKRIHSKSTATVYDYNADIKIESPRL